MKFDTYTVVILLLPMIYKQLNTSISDKEAHTRAIPPDFHPRIPLIIFKRRLLATVLECLFTTNLMHLLQQTNALLDFQMSIHANKSN